MTQEEIDYANSICTLLKSIPEISDAKYVGGLDWNGTAGNDYDLATIITFPQDPTTMTDQDITDFLKTVIGKLTEPQGESPPILILKEGTGLSKCYATRFSKYEFGTPVLHKFCMIDENDNTLDIWFRLEQTYTDFASKELWDNRTLIPRPTS